MNSARFMRWLPVGLLPFLFLGCDSSDNLVALPVAPLVIDTFSTPVAETTAVQFITAPDILGTELDVNTLTRTSYGQVGGDATLSYAGPGTQVLVMVYDGGDGQVTSAFMLGPVDLTNGGLLTKVEVEVTQITTTDVIELEIDVLESAGNLKRSPLIRMNTTGTVVVPFSAFTTVGTGADFADAKQISLLWGIAEGESISIASISTTQ